MKKCPECGSVQTLKIKLSSFREWVVAWPVDQPKKFFPATSEVNAYACASCGKIFDMHLKNPENLAPYAGRGE